MNHKNARIRKLIARGLSNPKIAKTIGHAFDAEIDARINKIRGEGAVPKEPVSRPAA